MSYRSLPSRYSSASNQSTSFFGFFNQPNRNNQTEPPNVRSTTGRQQSPATQTISGLNNNNNNNNNNTSTPSRRTDVDNSSNSNPALYSIQPRHEHQDRLAISLFFAHNHS